MFKLFLLATFVTIAVAAPAPGLLHGVPSITSSSSSVVHGTVLAASPVLHGAVLSAPVLAAPALHGLSLGGTALHGAGLTGLTGVTGLAGLTGVTGLTGLTGGALHSGLVAAPASGLGHGILGVGLGLHGVH